LRIIPSVSLKGELNFKIVYNIIAVQMLKRNLYSGTGIQHQLSFKRTFLTSPSHSLPQGEEGAVL
jgi:hypothetical protein